MSSPNADAHDREVGKGLEGRLAETFTQVGTGLQLDEISHHWIQPTLFDVQVSTTPACQFLFPMVRGTKAPAC